MVKGRAQKTLHLELKISFDHPQMNDWELPPKRGRRRGNEILFIYMLHYAHDTRQVILKNIFLI